MVMNKMTYNTTTSVRPDAATSSDNNNKKRKRNTTAATGNNSNGAVPMFLRKTFGLIESCDPQVATWADDGLSFIVKDVDRFENESIPRCFKHNKFSSFVRQLNFYGFRKVRDDPVFLRDIDENSSKWCQFQHPCFQRGHPELLSEIKKASQTEPAEKEEVDALRDEVKRLRAEVKSLKTDMGFMATLLGDVTQQFKQQQQLQQQQAVKTEDASGYDSTTAAVAGPAQKKRRVSPVPSPAPPAVASGGNGVIGSPPDVSTVKPLPLDRTGSNLSAISLTSEDEQFLESLFDNQGDEFFVPPPVPDQAQSH